MKNFLRLLMGLAAVASGAAEAAPAPHEFMDEQTANTLLVTDSPLVFARERSDVAAHARDYVTIVALEVDTSGQYNQYLLTYRWSTVDPRMAPLPPPSAGELRILADGRTIELKAMEQLPVGLGMRAELLVPNHGEVVAHAYHVDVPTLRYIATSRTLVVRLPQEPLDIPLRLWKDGRSALTEFLAHAAPR